jgi:hypothetical protein
MVGNCSRMSNRLRMMVWLSFPPRTSRPRAPATVPPAARGVVALGQRDGLDGVQIDDLLEGGGSGLDQRGRSTMATSS